MTAKTCCVTTINTYYYPLSSSVTQNIRNNIWSQIDFTRSNGNSEHFGINSLRYKHHCKFQDIVLNGMKNVTDIETSKKNIRK